MIDFTTIELNPIPPNIVELQSVNNKLNTENQIIKGLILSLLIIGVAGKIYLIITEAKKNVIKNINITNT
jgi:hypothetical protein